jgi:hypothetical protein
MIAALMGGKKAFGEWVAQHIGPGKKFPNRHRLSRTAKVGNDTIGRAIEGSESKIETVIALADAFGESRIKAFVMRGWLRPEDVDANLLQMPEENQQVLKLYYSFSPDARRQWLEIGHILLENPEN